MRRAVLGILPAPARIAAVVMGAVGVPESGDVGEIAPREAITAEDVINEVEGDLGILEEYLLDAVFRAAGIVPFRKQEIDRLWHRFHNIPHVWSAIAENEYVAENPKLLAELPDSLCTPVFDEEIATRLRQLRGALEGAQALF